MDTERIATDIRVIWDDDCNTLRGWFVRYTSSDGQTCDETARCYLAPHAASDDRLRDMAFDALEWAGHIADDLDAITIER